MIKNLSDKDLVKLVKRQRCSESFLELRERHMGIIMSLYHKYSGAFKTINYNVYDYSTEIDNILYSSIQSFDLRRKIKFSSWLYYNYRFFCLNILDKLNKIKPADSESQDKLIDLIDKHIYKASNTSDDDTYNFIDNILKQFSDKRLQDLFHMRYFQNDKKMTWKDIGNKLGITSQTAINLHNKAIKLIKSKMESNNDSDII